MQDLKEIRDNDIIDFDMIRDYLGEEADYLLNHKCEKILKKKLYLPGPDFIDKVFINSDRNNQVLRNLKSIFNHGRLSGTGYLSILPVDRELSIQLVRLLHRILIILILRI